MMKRSRSIGLLSVLVFGSIPGAAYAEESVVAPEPVVEQPRIWSIAVELGAVYTSGNTEQENLKFVSEVIRDGERTINTAHVDGLRSTQNNIVTAQKYHAFYQFDYKLEGDHSVFGRASYEQDDFSGYDYQAELTAGYSRLLMARETFTWRGDLGAGVRESKFVTGEKDSEFITRIATDFIWQLSESSVFKQLLSAEIGEKSTITRSETSIEANIAGNLAMKAAVIIKNQSEVPAGREKRDTESSITLVYRL